MLMLKPNPALYRRDGGVWSMTILFVGAATMLAVITIASAFWPGSMSMLNREGLSLRTPMPKPERALWIPVTIYEPAPPAFDRESFTDLDRIHRAIMIGEEYCLKYGYIRQAICFPNPV